MHLVACSCFRLHIFVLGFYPLFLPIPRPGRLIKHYFEVTISRPNKPLPVDFASRKRGAVMRYVSKHAAQREQSIFLSTRIGHVPAPGALLLIPLRVFCACLAARKSRYIPSATRGSWWRRPNLESQQNSYTMAFYGTCFLYLC